MDFFCKKQAKALPHEKKLLISGVWELHHITIGQSVYYECPIVLTNIARYIFNFSLTF